MSRTIRELYANSTQQEEIDALREQLQQVLDASRRMAETIDSAFDDSADSRGAPLYHIKAASIAFYYLLNNHGIPTKAGGKNDTL